MTHPKGRFIYTWPQDGFTRVLLCQVTGKWNDVYVEDTLHPSGRFMPRHYFEHTIEQLTAQFGAVCTKPTRKVRAKRDTDGV